MVGGVRALQGSIVLGGLGQLYSRRQLPVQQRANHSRDYSRDYHHHHHHHLHHHLQHTHHVQASGYRLRANRRVGLSSVSVAEGQRLKRRGQTNSLSSVSVADI